MQTTRRQLLTAASGLTAAAFINNKIQAQNGWAIDWHWNKGGLPTVPDLGGGVMSTWQQGIMDQSRMVLITAPRMMPHLLGAWPEVKHEGTITTQGIYQDSHGESQVIMQACDSKTDPVLSHAQLVAKLGSVYKFKSLIAMQAGKQAELMAALRSTPKVDPRVKCDHCETRAKIQPVQDPGYGSCDFLYPDTCTTGEYQNTRQNSLWWQGVAGYRPYYYALPTFPGQAGVDSNYPLDQPWYTPNLNQNFIWCWAPDPVYLPDGIQRTKQDQINQIAFAIGFIGALWSIGGFMAAQSAAGIAGAIVCPVCGAAAIAAGLIILLIKWGTA